MLNIVLGYRNEYYCKLSKITATRLILHLLNNLRCYLTDIGALVIALAHYLRLYLINVMAHVIQERIATHKLLPLILVLTILLVGLELLA